MKELTTVGLDIGKRVLHAHGADCSGAALWQRKLRREEVLAFFAGLPRCLIGMEACATAHYCAREISALGHEVRLIPPAYVKPYVLRQKNDAADAARYLRGCHKADGSHHADQVRGAAGRSRDPPHARAVVSTARDAD